MLNSKNEINSTCHINYLQKFIAVCLRTISFRMPSWRKHLSCLIATAATSRRSVMQTLLMMSPRMTSLEWSSLASLQQTILQQLRKVLLDAIAQTRTFLVLEPVNDSLDCTFRSVQPWPGLSTNLKCFIQTDLQAGSTALSAIWKIWIINVR